MRWVETEWIELRWLNKMTNGDAKEAESRRNVLCCVVKAAKTNSQSGVCSYGSSWDPKTHTTQKRIQGKEEREGEKKSEWLSFSWFKRGKNLVSFHFPHYFYSSHLLSLYKYKKTSTFLTWFSHHIFPSFIHTSYINAIHNSASNFPINNNNYSKNKT